LHRKNKTRQLSASDSALETSTNIKQEGVDQMDEEIRFLRMVVKSLMQEQELQRDVG
jgi:hypothetical protein